jgi:hypothetical protein
MYAPLTENWYGKIEFRRVVTNTLTVVSAPKSSSTISKADTMPATPIYTIGYGSRDRDAFLDTLKAHQIQYLIDIRSSPFSSYKPEFSKNSLQNYLETNGIRYVHMGDSLGGQPDDDNCYTEGKVDYEKVAGQSFYQEGIKRLRKAGRQGQRIVLMCSEGKPENCHRSKLIGKTLTTEGEVILHIDEKDEVITQKQVLLRLTDGQLSLFGDDFLTFTSRKRYRDDQT